MKPYGVKKKDRGCCPGHDKYPSESYGITKQKAVRKRKKSAKSSERQRALRDAKIKAGEMPKGDE